MRHYRNDSCNEKVYNTSHRIFDLYTIYSSTSCRSRLQLFQMLLRFSYTLLIIGTGVSAAISAFGTFILESRVLTVSE